MHCRACRRCGGRAAFVALLLERLGRNIGLADRRMRFRIAGAVARGPRSMLSSQLSSTKMNTSRIASRPAAVASTISHET